MEKALKHPRWMEGLSPNILYWLSYCPDPERRRNALDLIEKDFLSEKGVLRDLFNDGTLLEHVGAAKGTLKDNPNNSYKKACLVTDCNGLTPLFYGTIFGTHVSALLNSEYAESFIPTLISNQEYEEQVADQLLDPEELAYMHGLYYLRLMGHEGSYHYAYNKMIEIFDPFRDVTAGPLLLPVMNGYLRVVLHNCLDEVPSLLQFHPEISRQLDKIHRLMLPPIPDLQVHIDIADELIALYKAVPREYRRYFDPMERILKRLLKPHCGTGTPNQNAQINFHLFNADLMGLTLFAGEDDWVQYKTAAQSAYQYLCGTSDYRQTFELSCNVAINVERAGLSTGQEFRQDMNQVVNNAMTALNRVTIPTQEFAIMNNAVMNLITRYAKANPYSLHVQKFLQFVNYCFTVNSAHLRFSDDIQFLLQLRNNHRADVQFVHITNGFIQFLLNTFKSNPGLNGRILYEWAARDRRENFNKLFRSYDVTELQPAFYDAKVLQAKFVQFREAVMDPEYPDQDFHFANACGSLLWLIQHHACNNEFRKQVIAYCHLLIEREDYSTLHPSVGKLLDEDAPEVGRSAFIEEVERLSRGIFDVENQKDSEEEPLKTPTKRDRTPLVASPNGQVSPSKLLKTHSNPYLTPRTGGAPLTPSSPLAGTPPKRRLVLDEADQNAQHANSI